MLPKLAIVLHLFYLLHVCRSQDLIFRIFGGRPVQIEEAPYDISFQVDGIHYCGGTIIREDVILTAAHCIVRASTNGTMSIRAGSTSWKTGGTLLEVQDYLIHPDYSKALHDNDIGLLWLDGKLSFSDQIQIVPDMAAQDEPAPPASTMTFVAGWGLTEFGTYPEMLRGVDLPIIDHDQCKQLWDVTKLVDITPRMICAGVYPDGKKDTCSRDSGAGLVVSGKLVGVTNFGPTPCGTGTMPGVYANVASFRQWIDDSINNHLTL